MKAFLLHRDRDFDLKRELPENEGDLSRDLELDTLFEAMARDDKLILEVVRKAILSATSNDIETVEYRQAALKDCLGNPEVVRRLYSLAGDVFLKLKKLWPRFREYPTGLLGDSVTRMQTLMEALKQVRALAGQGSADFRSEAFSSLFAMIARELDDEYFKLVDRQLKRLNFRNGVLMSVGLGKGLKGKNYILRRPLERPPWLDRLRRTLEDALFGRQPDSYTIFLPPRDEQGARTLTELMDRGLGIAADALAKSSEHVESFFKMLQAELAFYVGCLNLHEPLLALGAPFIFPAADKSGAFRFSCRELYDLSLALSMNRRPVGNDINADDKNLIIVTGANQGGKTTFLRSLGLAQLMTQCGMFAPASRLSLNIVDGLFTHFKREEDATMKSGKFDEELARMDRIAGALTAHAMVLFNESFSATNEREGSEIARQIVSALLEKAVKVVFVSHQYAFAHGFHEKRLAGALFLRADREPNGKRSFKLVEGEPLTTSFGQDVYREVFSREGAAP
jgi:MutS domain V